MSNQILCRFEKPSTVNIELVQRIISGGECREVKIGPISGANGEISVPDLVAEAKSKFRGPSARVEIEVAKFLHQWLRPVIAKNPLLLKDDAMWSWISCYPLRDYTLRRWCKGAGVDGQPFDGTAGLSYFISKSDIKGQARCASKRLYIAADTSLREKGDYSRLDDYFSDTDLFSTIFERQIFLRPSLAGALVDRFKEIEKTLTTGKARRQAWRRIARSLNLALGTFVLESLEEEDMKAFVDSVTT